MTYRFRITGPAEITYWVDGETREENETVEALWWRISKRWTIRFLPDFNRPDVRIDFDARPRSEIRALAFAHPLRGGRTRFQIASDVGQHLPWVLAHELGHHLMAGTNADHQPAGLMNIGGPDDREAIWEPVDVAAWDAAFPGDPDPWRREGAERRLRRAHGPWETARCLFLRYLDRQPAPEGIGFWGNLAKQGHDIEPAFRARSVWQEDHA